VVMLFGGYFLIFSHTLRALRKMGQECDILGDGRLGAFAEKRQTHRKLS
jgi:hypothetical protein